MGFIVRINLGILRLNTFNVDSPNHNTVDEETLFANKAYLPPNVTVRGCPLIAYSEAAYL